MLGRLARYCSHHRKFIVLAWVFILVGINVLGTVIKDDWLQNGDLPGAESTKAFKTLERDFPSLAGQGNGESGKVVFESTDGISADRPAIEAYLAKVKALPGVADVGSPFDAANRIARSGKIAYADVSFAKDAKLVATAHKMEQLAGDTTAGPKIEFSGYMFQDFVLPPTELAGVFGAIIILLIAFGSVVAAGLPIVVALFGIGVAMGLTFVLTSVLGLPQFTPNVVQMIGLGVGIDYALFIVTRFREARGRKDQFAAVEEAMTTAGRAVFFAGITVVISMLGMVLIGLSFVRGMAISAALAVLVVVGAALTLVPALLAGRIGRSIDRWHVPFFGRPPKGETFWHRWSRGVQRLAWPAAIGGTAFLVVLAIPLFSLHLGTSDDGNLPTSDTTRRSYDLLAEGYGPGSNGPLIATVEGNNLAGGVTTLVDTLRKTPGIAFVGDPITSENGKAVFLTMVPTTGPQARATEQLVHHLRDDVIPSVAGPADLTVHLGGLTPLNVDFADFLGQRLPLFMGAVLLLSFLLLMAVFRSILVPLKAVIMNLLSIGAAYGLIVAVFQNGWLSSVFGVGRAGPVEPWIPMFLFAIVFGLSMDYEVFLLSKIREEYDATGDNSVAVVEGLASTARVITAAAGIMVLVFAGFIPGVRPIKMMGLGLAAAVLIDATVVRMILVPATMELLGPLNWWFPKWLDRLIPRLNVEVPPATGTREVSPVR